MKKNFIVDRLLQYALLMRLHKPIGIFLLLWPTLWALWIAAKGWPHKMILTVFVAGVVLMRSAGCIINDFADRHFDPHVERTKTRPLAARKIHAKEALALFTLLCCTAFGLVLLLNQKTIYLSFVAVLLAICYPFMKRFTYWPQLFLGFAYSWSIPMAFMAVTGSIPAYAWIIFFCTVLWTIAYDTEYAMVDRSDDLKIGIKSTAILFGDYDRLCIGFLHFLVLLGLAVLGLMLNFHIFYFICLMIALCFAMYQQYLINKQQTHLCLKAFLNNQWFGCVIFVGIFLTF
jgi:4-hydroxybenzoate polyprenyltransferase